MRSKKSWVNLKKLLLLVIIITIGCAPKVKKEVPEAALEVRVHLATLSAQDMISFKGDFYLLSEEARYEFAERNNSLTLVPLTEGMQLLNENRNLIFQQKNPVVLEPKDDESYFLFRGNEYSGAIILIPTLDATLYVINKLPVEEYLRGVVPAEIFTTRQDLLAAIKAQAICARTYVIKKLEQNKGESFDIHSSVSDQVYKGISVHTPLGDQAIRETRGMILSYNNQPAIVYYHSTCGGLLESAEHVWPERGKTYLDGGIDAVENTYSCRTSPHFRWTEKRSFTQIDSALKQHFHIGYLHTPVQDTLNLSMAMDITKRSPNGRVEEVSIAYGDTSVILSGYEIRRFFAKPPLQYLKSNLFYFSQDSDSTVQLQGGGNGHGVGMCQFGAMSMSQRGFRYYHILAKYFPGTKLLKLYR
jgi:stage II sporulation protein D